MNKHYSAIPVAFLGCILALSVLSGQDKPQESVTVTAVEIPVRVFDGNGFVPGLTKDDFEVYENGIRQDISGFEAVSRSILPSSVTLPEPIPKLPRRRNFVLIFNVSDYTDQIGDAIDFFFKDIFHPGDRLIVALAGKAYQINPEDAGENAVAKIKGLLIDSKKRSHNILINTFETLERKTESLLLALQGNGAGSEYDTGEGDRPESVRRFLDDYKRIWGSYRAQNLDTGLDFYKYVADRMQRLDGDKWAICFQQRALFPKLRSQTRLTEELDRLGFNDSADTRSRLVKSQLDTLEQSFDVNNEFPGEKIRELFTTANVTFHVLLMKPVGLQAGLNDELMESGDVGAEYEDTLRRISRVTGGLTIFSNKVIDTLKEASTKLDQYYLLVYQPKKGLTSPENKIEVRVRKEHVEVISLKERTPVKAEGITIFDFEAGPKSIAFRLKNYARAPLEWKERGRAAIKVTIFDDQSAKVFFKETTLDLVAETIRLSLDLNAPPPGSYFVVIEAYDVVSGDKAVFSSSIVLE